MHKSKQEHQSNRTQPYTDSRFMTTVPFGAYSPWLQPWRGMLETIPARQFLDGIGIVFNPPPGSETPLAKHLARYGFTQARVEIPWNHLDMSDRFTPAAYTADQHTLQTLMSAGIRPLILLYAHQGAPCPLLLFTRPLAAPARKGDRSIHLTETSELVVGRSGINNLSGYWAAEALVLRIEGEEVFLSKPLPKDLGEAGKAVSMATLKYAPFGPPESAEYRETMSGWKQFIGQVVGLANEAIGVGSYDLEIWNELTFGSNFLAINKYHERPIATYNERELWRALVRETAAWAEANPAKTRGVRIADGFSNTIPWPSADQEPERVSALCKHPYAGRRTYPKETPVPPMINALFQSEAKPRFRQSYTELFPEYFATWLQTESILRDAAPQTTEIYKVRHG